eukprot:m.47757 g.47757  ORF g.47757 m.47757 type:complete len:194 (-) comp10997_c0_seq1:312-893(-)
MASRLLGALAARTQQTPLALHPVRWMSATRPRRKPNRNPPVKMVLLKDVASLGDKGSIVEVARGYGRNFLVPRGMAMFLTPKTKQQHYDPAAQTLAGKAQLVSDEDKQGMKIQTKLNESVIDIRRHMPRNFELSVSIIQEACRQQLFLDIPEEMFEIQAPITRPGLFEVLVNLQGGRRATLQVELFELKQQTK